MRMRVSYYTNLGRIWYQLTSFSIEIILPFCVAPLIFKLSFCSVRSLMLAWRRIISALYQTLMYRAIKVVYSWLTRISSYSSSSSMSKTSLSCPGAPCVSTTLWVKGDRKESDSTTVTNLVLVITEFTVTAAARMPTGSYLELFINPKW